MPKFSVKKPLTVFVAVIAVLVLGVVSYLRMTPDLLPNMNFPYIMITTTYPGASPEKVEAEVTKPMEQAMSTLEHIKEITSTSNENYSLVLLEFEESVNMDTIGVDIQQKLTSLASSWDEMVGSPYVLKINPSMLPVEVAAVSMDGMDTVELTEFLNDTLMPKLEGITGVARITASGTVEQELHVVLDQQKIDLKNAQIANAINGKLDDAADELLEKRDELESAQEQIDNARTQLDNSKASLSSATASAEAELSQQQAELVSTKAELQNQVAQLKSSKSQMEMILTPLKAIQSAINAALDQMNPLKVELNELYALRQKANDLEYREAAFYAQVQAVYENPELSDEEKQLLVDQLYAGPEYAQIQADRADLEFQLSVRGLDLAGLDARIAELENAIANIEATIESTKQQLADLGVEVGLLGSKITELEENIAQMDEAIAYLEQDVIPQLDSGMLQLKDASRVLSQQKTSGLLEMSSAMADLAANAAQMDAALAQMDSGLDSIESSRQDALAKADLNDILTMDMISSILKAQSFYMPAGYVTQDGVSYMVSVGEEITDLEVLKNLLLFDPGMDGVDPIRLEDVAIVTLTDNRDESYARLNGEQSIALSFEKQSTYATAGATKNINARFRQLEEQYPGLHFVALMDQGDYIYMIVNNILRSLLLGALFAILILFLFLRDLRPTFITLCAIPISVIFAIVLMYFSGVTINMISLSGLAVAVGMLVDNSVVVIENIHRLRSKGASAIQAAVAGAGQVAGAVTASTLTTVCVFLPIVFVEGITRQLFTDLALTMSYALLASLIVSLTLVPAMASGMLRKKKKEKQDGFFAALLRGYEKIASFSLNHKFLVLALAVAALIVTACLSVARGFTFMPDMDMPSVNVTVTMPEDYDMAQATELADEVLARVSAMDGIETAGAMMSSGGGSLLGMGGGSGTSLEATLYITLADDKASGARMGEKIVRECADLPCEITASSAMMDMSALTGSGITLELYGENMDVLQNAARAAAEALENVEGVQNVSDGLEDAAPALHIQVDRDKAMSQGLTIAQIYMEVSQALSNIQQAHTLVLSGTTTDIVVERPMEHRLDVDMLKAHTFETTGTDGETNTVRLTDVAEIEETTSLDAISRKNQRRCLTVTAEVVDGYNVTLITNQAAKAMEALDLGEGVSYAFAGENETIMEAVEQLLLMLLLGVLLVYLVMVAQFQSLKSPFIVMFTIPLAFTGGFLALLLCGMEISVISLVGFIMLTGIIVNNGIVLVDYINQLRADGMARRAAILEAGKTRMRPILMTSITTILGLADMALSRAAGSAIMQPIAVVCIGGLIYATLMTLLVVPCIYDIVNKKELRVVRDEDMQLQENL
ncbi:MAG: efflux RND transporter permease subunit [Clostridiales bacterium]|nr:efflux RND transporter permease subunit [Clostridiales bacterium]